jgi:hypothetical protein
MTGYLSASEIVGLGLKLDADWVILSACNTAGGALEADGSLEPCQRILLRRRACTAGLAFGKSIPMPTSKLITQAVAKLKSDRRIGRTEALRRSMSKLMAKTDLRHRGASRLLGAVRESAKARPGDCRNVCCCRDERTNPTDREGRDWVIKRRTQRKRIESALPQ